MIYFGNIDKTAFLRDYWQKKPLVLRNAIPNFIAPIDADELAGLALEEEVESRLVFEISDSSPQWLLKHGPFSEQDFNSLPETHWTLLVQGMDRIIPEIAQLRDHFNFIPAWRFDDVMVSFAPLHGSVGPHYDNYDVFLYQASGQRRWSLTTKNCHEENALVDVDLRIMAEFDVEEKVVLNPGDMLYLPPHVGHHGVSLSDDCMTYSFGYRSYPAQELWDSFGDYLSEQGAAKGIYVDPSWDGLKNNAEIPMAAVMQAKNLLQNLIDDEISLQRWFTRFATQLDAPALQALDEPLSEQEAGTLREFIQELEQQECLERHSCCRMAYHVEQGKCYLSINGEEWDTESVSFELIQLVANNRKVNCDKLSSLLQISKANQKFIYKLWQQQFLF